MKLILLQLLRAIFERRLVFERRLFKHGLISNLSMVYYSN